MDEWEHGGGFSVDAQVRIENRERDGLERLLRTCARPASALKRLCEMDPEHLVHESVKLGPGGRVSLMLTPMRLFDRLAALIPPLRKHRHRTYGRWRPATRCRQRSPQWGENADAPTLVEPTPLEAAPARPLHRKAARYVWALLPARIYEMLAFWMRK